MYEFLGCYYHGHTCQPYRDVTTIRGDTLKEITRAGYEVELQWECEFDEEILTRHPDLKTHPVVLHCPLNTQDALYGGRTEAVRLHYKIRAGEEAVQYVHVMNLYPNVCKYFKFPLGHAVIHVGDACQDTEAMLRKEGLIKCCVLPPQKLYHSVLPCRCNDRLLFCLCKTCPSEQNGDGECAHETVAERVLIGT